MEHVMDKKKLDTFGGLGSILAGLFCIWLAVSHDPRDPM